MALTSQSYGKGWRNEHNVFDNLWGDTVFRWYGVCVIRSTLAETEGCDMSAYYNEIDPFAAQWLRELIKAGHIAEGSLMKGA